jgi:hypothetical protein
MPFKPPIPFLSKSCLPQSSFLSSGFEDLAREREDLVQQIATLKYTTPPQVVKLFVSGFFSGGGMRQTADQVLEVGIL